MINYSSVPLSLRLQTLLAFGLDFCLPVFDLNFFKYFLPLESLASKLKSHDVPNDKYFDFIREFQNICLKYYYVFKKYKTFSAIFSKSDIKLLKSLGCDKSIIITKPDKGKGVVIINKTDYLNSMKNLISDVTKFKKINDSYQKFTLRIENKINRFLLKLTNKKYSLWGIKDS